MTQKKIVEKYMYVWKVDLIPFFIALHTLTATLVLDELIDVERSCRGPVQRLGGGSNPNFARRRTFGRHVIEQKLLRISNTTN